MNKKCLTIYSTIASTHAVLFQFSTGNQGVKNILELQKIPTFI